MRIKSFPLPSAAKYILGSEFAERWSFYGFKAILVIYLTLYMKTASGTMDTMSQPEAKVFLHTFIMIAYFFPLVGAVLADAFFGRYRTILGMSVIYALGHFLIALVETRTGLMWGCLLIGIGAGGIKPNVSTLIAEQVPPKDKKLLESIYSWLYVFINLGSCAAFLTSEKILKSEFLVSHGLNVKVAFGIPGVLMVISAIILVLGKMKGKFNQLPPLGWTNYKKQVLGEGKKLLLPLIPLYFGAVSIFWALFDQTAGAWVLQAMSDLMNKLLIGGIEFQPSEVQVFNPALVILLTPLMTTFVYPYVRKYIRFSYLRKIGVGFFLAALSFFLITYVQWRMDHGVTMHVSWQIVGYIILTIAEILVSITVLEFSFKIAPKSMRSLIMSLYSLSIVAGNFLVALVNKFMLVPLSVLTIDAGNTTTVQFTEPVPFSINELVSIEGLSGIKVPVWDEEKQDSIIRYKDLGGEYKVLSVDQKNNSIEIGNIGGDIIESTGEYNPDHPKFPPKVCDYRLQGAEYFGFFAVLMLITALLFPMMIRWYKARGLDL